MARIDVGDPERDREANETHLEGCKSTKRSLRLTVQVPRRIEPLFSTIVKTKYRSRRFALHQISVTECASKRQTQATDHAQTYVAPKRDKAMIL